MLTTTDDNKLDTSKVDPNLLAAGQSGGKTYGTPIGANTLALYYNKKVLKEAGVDIASVKDWTSLTAALAKVKKAGKKGITFSAIGTEEGSFQFLPWFWGSGAKLTELDSPQAVSALSLWKDWLKKGYAPNSVINNTQTTSWQEFASGDYAFAENGTWQLANAEKAGFDYGVMPVPGADGRQRRGPDRRRVRHRPGPGRHRPLRHLAEARDLPDQHREPATTPTPPCPTWPPPARSRTSRWRRTPS